MSKFEFEKLPAPRNFCGREKELKQLKTLVQDGKNVVLFGDRRYGKTSLIEHCQRQLNGEKNILFAYADLFSCVTPQDVATEIYTSVYKAMPFNIERTLKEIAGSFSRMTLEVKASGSGIKAIPKLNSRNFDELLEDALHGADDLCERLGKKMIIAIDEFQQIAEIDQENLDAIFREYMQRLNHVSFIFSGSKKSILSKLFTNKNKPLYMMASSIAVTGIDIQVFHKYCNERLNGDLSFENFERLYLEVRGQTKLILQVCWWLDLEEIKGDINYEAIDSILDNLINEKHEEFKIIYNGFTQNQKKALKLITNSSEEEVFGSANLKEYGFNSKQSTLQVMNKLLEEGVIDKLDKGKYRLNDVYFSLWCKKHFLN